MFETFTNNRDLAAKRGTDDIDHKRFTVGEKLPGVDLGEEHRAM